jgi:hypothetical protein
MLLRWSRSVLLGWALLFGTVGVVHHTTAIAEDTAEGVPVKVIVLDQTGAAVPTAVVRHPKEADRHRVNTFDGSWEAAVLYLPDGTELKFLPGMTIDLEISAPGYVLQQIQYQVRKRKNVVEVRLEKMALELAPADEEDDINIGFGRDVPIDGQ